MSLQDRADIMALEQRVAMLEAIVARMNQYALSRKSEAPSQTLTLNGKVGEQKNAR